MAKLLDRVRERVRTRHDRIRTEDASVQWITARNGDIAPSP